MSLDPDPSTRRRVDILAYPSPTTGRYLVLVLALLTSGMFVGNWLHNEVAGQAWASEVLACETTAGSPAVGEAPQDPLARRSQIQACKAPREQSRAAWSLGGALIIGAGGLLVMYTAPVVVRLRRRLTQPGPALEPVVHRFQELCTEFAVPEAPALALGSAGQLDAFSFGVPGRYSIVLPKAVAVKFRDPAVFDAVVRHELAHVYHRDVALSWLARGTWYFLGPVLLVPFIWSLVEQDPSLLSSYVWRVALLAAAVELAAAALLRAREFEADLTAARGGANLAHMHACLQLLMKSESRRRTGFRALGRHPIGARRQAVLKAPWLAARVGFTDAAVAAFLAALAMPLIVGVLIPLLTGTGLTNFAETIAALVTGPLLGSSIGLGLWRSAAVAWAANAESPLPTAKGAHHFRGSPLPVVALGAAVGLLLGQIASLAQTGASMDSQGVEMLAPMILGMGAVAFSAALGEVWAHSLALMKRPALAWGLALATNCVLFTTAVWLWDSLRALLGGPGWNLARIWLTAGLGALPLLVATVLIVGCAAVGLYLRTRAAGRKSPPWLFEGATHEAADTVQSKSSVPGPGNRAAITSGLVAGVVLTGIAPTWRLVEGPAASAGTAQQRVITIIWACAAVWGAFLLTTLLFRARTGPTAAILGGFVATGTGATGLLVYNTLSGGTSDITLVSAVVAPAIGLGFVLALAAGSLTVFTAPLRNDQAPDRTGLFQALTTAATVLVGTATVGLAPVLAGPGTDAGSSMGGSYLTELAEVEGYATKLAPHYAEAYENSVREQLLARAMYTTDPLQGAGQLRTKAIPVLSTLRTEVESLSPRSQRLSALHVDLLEAVKTAEQEYSLEATAVESLDAATIRRFSYVRDELQAKVTQYLTRWREGLVALRQALRQP